MLQLGSKFAQTMLMHRISCWDKNNLQPDTGEPVSLVLLNWLIQWGLQLLTYSLQYVVCRSFKGRNRLVNSGILARNQRKALLPTLLCLNQYIEPWSFCPTTQLMHSKMHTFLHNISAIICVRVGSVICTKQSSFLVFTSQTHPPSPAL